MTDTTPISSALTPFKAGALELPNRIVMAPMTRSRAGEGNAPTDLVREYYVQRAAAGLIITEATQVSPHGVGYPATPGIHTDQQVAAWRRVTDAVHDADGRIVLQLWHVGRISHPSFQPNGIRPVAPSAIRPAGEGFTSEGMKAFETPRALELDEIPDVVRQFGDGTRRAIDAGFDGVEIHAANGYLIDQFLRDGSNQRTDGYGGSIENRARFLIEVTEAVAGAWSPDRVGIRLSPTSPFNDMADSDPVATFGYAAEALAPYGLAYLHVIEPVAEEGPRLGPALKRAFGGPFMVNGSYDLATADAVIDRGEADMVSFAQLYLANPDLVERFRRGAPLNEADPATFYGGTEIGYTDYPTLAEAEPSTTAV